MLDRDVEVEAEAESGCGAVSVEAEADATPLKFDRFHLNQGFRTAGNSTSGEFWI